MHGPPARESVIKIYVSGSYAEKARLRAEAHSLYEMGFEITSSWLQETTKPEHLTQEEWYRGLADKDLEEVASADCIVLDVVGISTSGGRYTEWGYAIGRRNMLKLLVGTGTLGVFDTRADHRFADWDAVRAYLQEHLG